MKKLNVKISTHIAVDLDMDTMVLYSRPDRATTFWNKDCKMISALPKMGFKAKIALKIMGIFFIQDKDPNAAYRVKLHYHLDQVKVVLEGNDEDELLKSCMFK
jgi:hypothetical protein